MKAGMALGLIGGVIALLIGAVGYGLTTTLDSVSDSMHSTNQSMGFKTPKPASLAMYGYLGIIIPVIALIGAGMAGKKPMLSIALMSGSAILMLFIFGIGMMSLVPAALLGVGSLLVFLEKDKDIYINKV